MKYNFIHATNEENIDKVHRFRYKVMHDELGMIQDNKSGIEADAYDEYSDQFAILDSNGEVCCTMRLIHHSAIGYPTERFLDLEQPQYQFDRDKLSEMSRIFIDQKHRNMRDTKIFISSIAKSLAYEKIKEYGIEHCYGMLEANFLKLVNMFRVPYQAISGLENDFNKLKHPSILYVKDMENQNPQIEEYWRKYKKVPIEVVNGI